MQDKSSYHRSAVQYNEALAAAAETQAEIVEHPEVKKWCRAIGKQHRFHAKRHKSALAKIEREQNKQESVEETVTEEAAV